MIAWEPAMDTEQRVARHYTHGALEGAILNVLAAQGKNIEALTPSDLAGADEFHLGWHPATAELARELELASDMHVLDVGSGLGGPARHFAEAYRCRVTGIDLTEEFVRVAQSLTRRCGLDDRVRFQQGSALDMPFSDATFDAAAMIHVGMNIADKARLFRSVRRVLKPNARFAAYDVMLTGTDALPFPMPWADSPETSFVETPEAYRRLLSENEFVLESEHDRRDFSLALWRQMREHAALHGPPALGAHILMGSAAPARLGNVMTALEGGLIAPIAIIARAA
jgi:SAM-dependent methyltransferase